MTGTEAGTGPDSATGRALLAVEDLHVHYARPRGLFRRRPVVRAVNGVSFEVPAGTAFGLVGESGSGKSTVARAVLGLVAPSAGRALVDGRDVADVKDQLAYRSQVQAVLQDPYATLNPAHPVRVIVGDAVTAHHGTPRGTDRDDEVAALLASVGLPADLLGRRPRELSGGQRQRVSIARALAVRPDLLIADEPASALDVSVQAQVVNLLAQVRAERGLTLVVISHDLDIIDHLAGTVGVMYAGQLVETGPTSLRDSPAHPYTQMLTASAPDPDPAARADRRQARRLFATTAKAGTGGDGGRAAQGCPFADRCPAAFKACTAMPEPSPAHHGGTVRCWLHTDGPGLAGGPVGPHLRTL